MSVYGNSLSRDEIITVRQDNDNVYGGDVIMPFLKNDKAFDRHQTIEIKDDDYIKFQIAAYEAENWAYSGDDSFTNIVMLSFSRWCRKFLNREYDFVVYQLPSHVENGGDCLKSSECNIRIDPYVSDISLNKFLSGNKIVTTVRKKVSDGTTVVTLDAVIPYDGSLFRYHNDFCFGRQLNFRNYKTANVEALSKRIGGYFEKSIFRDGKISRTFFIKYLRWRFKSMDNHELQRLNIDPKRENITIKSLFYDND